MTQVKNKAYYACFHGIVALLFSEGKKYSSHSAVISKFRKHLQLISFDSDFDRSDIERKEPADI